MIDYNLSGLVYKSWLQQQQQQQLSLYPTFTSLIIKREKNDAK